MTLTHTSAEYLGRSMSGATQSAQPAQSKEVQQ